MLGLSKKNKEEILQFPKLYGTIIQGMHQDFEKLRKDIATNIKSLETKELLIKSGITRIEAQQFLLESLCENTEKSVSETLRSIEAKIQLVNELETSVNRSKEEVIQMASITDTKLKENQSAIERILKSLNIALDEVNSKFLVFEQEIRIQLEIAHKKNLRNSWALAIIGTIGLISLVLHRV